MRNKKGGRLTTVLLVIIFLVGLSVMLYPAVSDWWNSRVQSRVVAKYQQAVAEIDDNKEKELLERAHEYNRALAGLFAPLINYEQVKDYYEILDITGTGIMGVINIPAIGVELPIYHGTSEGVLNVAVGHLQGSTLPVGGRNTHAVISAHRGLPSAKLFTDLDKLVEGDQFTITVLKEIYIYEVDKTSIVLPHETDELAILPGSDLVTLMTCTPYGINTHRLLVRAHRVGTSEVEGPAPEIKVLPDAVMVDSMSVVPFISAVPVSLLLAWWLFGGRRRKGLPKDDPLSIFDDDDKEKP